MHVYNKKISYYFNLLSPHEQLKEINELITFSKRTHSRHDFTGSYSKIMSLRNMKKDILSRIHTQCKFTFSILSLSLSLSLLLLLLSFPSQLIVEMTL